MERPPETDAPAGEGIPVARSTTSPFATLRVRELIGLFVLISLALAVVAIFTLPKSYEPDAPALMLSLSVVLGLPVLIRGYQTRLSWRRLFGPPVRSSDLPLVSAIVPVAMLTMASCYIIYLPLSDLAPDFVRRALLDDTGFDANTTGEWLLLALGAALLIPIVEELVFRGIILQRWAYAWGTPAASIASSALFALGHGEWFGHFLFGMLMALLYLRTRRLWVPILAHGLNNLTAVSPILWRILAHRPPDPPDTLTTLRAEAWIGWPALGVGLVLGWLYLKLLWEPGEVRERLRGAVPYDHQL